MALRRSRVRIPLGPHNVGIGLAPIQNRAGARPAPTKVTAGVVGHPVSELGKRGGSPTMVSNGNTKIP